MAVSDLLKIGNVISFSTVAPSILGAYYDDLKVVGIFDRDTAKLWRDVDSMHRTLVPYLPEIYRINSDSYQYVKLLSLSGATYILGVPWVSEDTIRITARGKLTLKMYDMSLEDKERVLSAIKSANIRIDEVTYE